jgi:hypothetical protein
LWTLIFDANDGRFGNGIEFDYVSNGKKYTAVDIARLRASRILLNDPEPRQHRSWNAEDSLISWIEGSGRYPVKECVVKSAFGSHATDPNWRTFARLKSVFVLKAAGVVDHVLELSIGAVRNGRVTVKFQGQRQGKYAGSSPELIEVTGTCPL